MVDISGLTFRLTNEKDFDAIKSIPTGLNPEFDYVIERYFTLLKDPCFHAAIADVQGEAVAFGVGYMQLGCTKVYNRSARVKEQWRKRGILGQLKKFLRETLRERFYPQLCVEEFTTHDTNFAIQKIIDNPNYVEVYRKPFVTIEPKVGLLHFPVDDFLSNVRDIGLPGLQKILESDSLRSKLFPCRLSIGFMTFEPIPSEVDLIGRQNPFVLASFGENTQGIRYLTIGVRESSGVFVVNWAPADDGCLNENQEEFSKHLQLQLGKMNELNKGGKCVVSFPKPHLPIVREVFTKLGCVEMEPMAAEFVGYRREF